jgi:two-component system NtrC family sensor kinase
VFANAVQLNQIVVNLCVNSIQAMPDGGKLILHTYSNKDQVVLVVQDTGTGISEDKLPKIFDPFFTTKDSETNTGLGLSVVHGIVTSYKGTISVESNLGMGTRFEIALPVKK